MVDLDDIRRTLIACKDVPWSCACITPQELEALVEEVERLREGEDGYRQGHSDGCEDERAAVVAWLRARNFLEWEADAIERGEHRREEKP